MRILEQFALFWPEGTSILHLFSRIEPYGLVFLHGRFPCLSPQGFNFTAHA